MRYLQRKKRVVSMVIKHVTKPQGEGSPTLEFESFSDISGPYLRNVCKTIADILTVTSGEAEKLMEANPKDAIEICQALMGGIKVHGSNTREWRSSSLALLPEENWVEFPDEPSTFHVQGMDGTTMVSYAYSQAAGGKSQSTEPKQLTNRRALHQALYERLTLAQQKTYAPLIAWPEPPEGSPLTSVFPHMQDMNLWKLVDAQLAEYGILSYTHEMRTPSTLTSASPLVDKLAAGKDLKRRTFSMLKDRGKASSINGRAEMAVSLFKFPIPDRNLKPGTPGYLIIRLLCNIAANRPILEQGRRAELEATSEKILVSFLSAIAACMPVPLPQSKELPSEQALVEFLTKNFGSNYSPLSGQAAALCLSPKDISVVVSQAMKLETGVKRSVSEIAENRLDGHTRFACLFAVMACRYSSEKIKDEQRSSARRNIYPPKTDASPETWTPSAEARSLMKNMVAALQLGMAWRDLSPEAVGGIAAAGTEQSAMMQTLLFEIFKKNEPDTLLELAYLRKLDIQNAQEKALAMGRSLKSNRDEHMQMRYAIEVLYGSWAATEPLPPQTVFQFHLAPAPSTQQWNWPLPSAKK